MSQHTLAVEASDKKTLDGLIQLHMESLAFPIDSWLEDLLLDSSLYALRVDDNNVGYAAVKGETLGFFHVSREHLAQAPDLLSRVVEELGIKKVQVITQDAQLCALIAEWEYSRGAAACFFADTGVAQTGPLPQAVFSHATAEDIADIRHISGGFFDEADNRFPSLEARVAGGILFTLRENGALLGCGIIETGRLMPGTASIGMFVAKEHRRRGAATRILIELRLYARRKGLTPVAGCWYYNTLSRRSLEAAGMAVAAIGFDAELEGRMKPPLRTGNPPGEPVE